MLNQSTTSSKTSKKNRNRNKKIPSDFSTINTNQSATSIPATVSTHTPVRGSFITNRPRKNKVLLIQYADEIKRASKSNKTSSQLDRRTSGFSKAISPMDDNYNPQSNQNVQGVTSINPDDVSLFKADVAQHGVQNQTYGKIHQQSS